MIVHHPFAYSFGFFQFTGFGVAVLLAFVIAQIIAQRELERRGHEHEYIPDLVFAAVLGGTARGAQHGVGQLGGGHGASVRETRPRFASDFTS